MPETAGVRLQGDFFLVISHGLKTGVCFDSVVNMSSTTTGFPEERQRRGPRVNTPINIVSQGANVLASFGKL